MPYVRPPVLDFGCGTGLLVDMLNSMSITAKGVDTRVTDHSHPELYPDLDDLEAISGAKKQMTVVMQHSLNHLKDPMLTLWELHTRVLEDCGRLVIVNPNACHHWLSLPKNLLTGYKSDPTIRHRYTLGSLCNALRYVGFTPMIARTWGLKSSRWWSPRLHVVAVKSGVHCDGRRS
jgi:hypothetical protein